MAKTDQTAQRHHGLQADTKHHQNQRVKRQGLPIRPAQPGRARRHTKRQHDARCSRSTQTQPSEFLGHLARCIKRRRGQAKQPLRAKHQHHRHRQKHQHQRRLREHTDAKRMHQPNQQRRHKRAANAAQPAHHHHHKGLDNHGHVHLQSRWLLGQLQRPAQTSQRAAQHHCTQHQRAGVDAQRRQHVAVLRGRTQTAAKQ